MIFDFRGKNVFVSGGTHGVGLECVLKFAKLGANIISFSRDEKKIKNLIRKLNKFKNIKFLVVKGDILDKSFPRNFAPQVLKKFNSIDILIHNVGGGGRWGNIDIAKTQIKTWYEVFDKNNLGLIEFTNFFLPNMIKKKWGRVIGINSVCGSEVTKEDRPWFVGAKVPKATQSFSKKNEYSKNNITFNSISPGPLLIPDTGWHKLLKRSPKKYLKLINQIPAERIGKPEDVANACLFLCSNYASYINGIDLVVDGGKINKI